jgi:hypothetical protein
MNFQPVRNLNYIFPVFNIKKDKKKKSDNQKPVFIGIPPKDFDSFTKSKN